MGSCIYQSFFLQYGAFKHIAALMGDTEKMVIEVYNHIILEKEDTVSAIEKALEM